MKNPFTSHPRSKNLTYLDHLSVAGSVGLRLFLSSVIFTVHAIFPFIPIPAKYNLHKTSQYLRETNGELAIRELDR